MFLSRYRYQLVLAVLMLVVLAQPLLMHYSPRMISQSVLLIWLLQIAVLAGLALAVVLTALGSWLSETPAVRGSWRRWTLTLALLTVAGVGLSGMAVLLKRGLPYGSFLRPFDQPTWCDPDSSAFVEDDLTPRQKMLGSVVRTVLKPGGQAATREAILAQLGPSETDAADDSAGQQLVYRLGPQHESLFAIDDDWLVISFDERGRLLQFQIRAD